MVSAVQSIRHFSGAAQQMLRSNPTVKVLSALTRLPNPCMGAYKSVEQCGFPDRATLEATQRRVEDVFNKYKQHCTAAKAACEVPGSHHLLRSTAQLLRGEFDHNPSSFRRAIMEPQEASLDLGDLLLYVQQKELPERENFEQAVRALYRLQEELKKEAGFFAEADSYAAGPFVDNLAAHRSMLIGGLPDMAAGYLRQALLELVRTITFHQEEDPPEQLEEMIRAALSYLAPATTIFSRGPVTAEIYRNMGTGLWNRDNAPTDPALLMQAITKTARGMMTTEGRPVPPVGLPLF